MSPISAKNEPSVSIDCHDIRLVAGFEARPESVSSRMLDRDQAEELTAALAADLARVVPGVEQAVLIGAGVLLEPAELLRPGWPAWSALLDLATPILREHNGGSRVLAVGSHGGRLPDRRLEPAEHTPLGQFLVIPLLLAVPGDAGPELERTLESELFERGGIAPPARALLERFTGVQSAHGQLLTATDLMALHHVQMDAGGMSAFWPLIEQILISPEQDAAGELPALLRARWDGRRQTLYVDFLVFDHFPDGPETYPLWQRALRTLTMLATAHGLHWRVVPGPKTELDEQMQLLIHKAGPIEGPDSLTEQVDPGVGLIAWTLVEKGFLRHVYPLTAAAAESQRTALNQRFNCVRRPGRLCYRGDPATLQPAPSE